MMKTMMKTMINKTNPDSGSFLHFSILFSSTQKLLFVQASTATAALSNSWHFGDLGSHSRLRASSPGTTSAVRSFDVSPVWILLTPAIPSLKLLLSASQLARARGVNSMTVV